MYDLMFYSYRMIIIGFLLLRDCVTFAGTLLSYLTKLPVLGTAHGTRLAYLTSLLEITIVNNVDEVSICLMHNVYVLFIIGSSYEI